MADQPDKRDSSPERRESAFAAGLPLGLAIGVAIGVSSGVAIDNLPLALAVGIALGIALSPAFGITRNNIRKSGPSAKTGSTEETSQ